METRDNDTRIREETTDNKSTIFIKDAEESEGGEYVCKVLDEEVKHLVNINDMPGIVAIPSTEIAELAVASFS